MHDAGARCKPERYPQSKKSHDRNPTGRRNFRLVNGGRRHRLSRKKTCVMVGGRKINLDTYLAGAARHTLPFSSSTSPSPSRLLFLATPLSLSLFLSARDSPGFPSITRAAHLRSKTIRPPSASAAIASTSPLRRADYTFSYIFF